MSPKKAAAVAATAATKAAKTTAAAATKAAKTTAAVVMPKYVIRPMFLFHVAQSFFFILM
jgi:hypothetical protein